MCSLTACRRCTARNFFAKFARSRVGEGGVFRGNSRSRRESFERDLEGRDSTRWKFHESCETTAGEKRAGERRTVCVLLPGLVGAMTSPTQQRAVSCRAQTPENEASPVCAACPRAATLPHHLRNLLLAFSSLVYSCASTAWPRPNDATEVIRLAVSRRSTSAIDAAEHINESR